MPLQLLADGTLIDTGLAGLGLVGSLMNPNASDASRAFAAAGTADSAASLIGRQMGGEAGSTLAGGAAGALPYLKLAALGYNLSNIAGSDLPVQKKVGHSVDSAVAAAVPMYGLSKTADYVFNKMEQSGSPQQRRFGQTLAAPTLPVQSLLSVFKGDKSPRAAASGMLNSTLSALGFDAQKPTTGTMFRGELGQIFDKLGIKGAKLDQYNVDLTKFTQAEIDSANRLAQKITGYSPTATKHADQKLWTQTAGILLNSFAQAGPSKWQKDDKGTLKWTGEGPAPLLDAGSQKNLRKQLTVTK